MSHLVLCSSEVEGRSSHTPCYQSCLEAKANKGSYYLFIFLFPHYSVVDSTTLAASAEESRRMVLSWKSIVAAIAVLLISQLAQAGFYPDTWAPSFGGIAHADQAALTNGEGGTAGELIPSLASCPVAVSGRHRKDGSLSLPYPLAPLNSN